jgi:hypothetical protein
VGSVADLKAGVARLSTAPAAASGSTSADPAGAVPASAAVVVGAGMLLLGVMVAGAFRARARLGRIG